MAEFSASPDATSLSSSGAAQEVALKVAALRTESQAAVEASDWATAAQKFREILDLDPEAEFAQDGLRRAHDRLGIAEGEEGLGEMPERSRNSIPARQLRMYIYVRRAVSRLLRRARPPHHT